MHHYLSGVVVQEDRSQITSRDIFLQERVVPPPLVVSLNPSKRPNNELRLERRFPPSQSVVQVWDGFRHAVEAFEPPEAEAPLVHYRCTTFKTSLSLNSKLKDESQE
jgi:hypothetical protein